MGATTMVWVWAGAGVTRTRRRFECDPSTGWPEGASSTPAPFFRTMMVGADVIPENSQHGRRRASTPRPGAASFSTFRPAPISLAERSAMARLTLAYGVHDK